MENNEAQNPQKQSMSSEEHERPSTNTHTDSNTFPGQDEGEGESDWEEEDGADDLGPIYGLVGNIFSAMMGVAGASSGQKQEMGGLLGFDLEKMRKEIVEATGIDPDAAGDGGLDEGEDGEGPNPTMHLIEALMATSAATAGFSKEQTVVAGQDLGVDLAQIQEQIMEETNVDPAAVNDAMT